MRIKRNSLIFIIICLLSCTNRKDINVNKIKKQLKDTLNVVDINSEFGKRLDLTGQGVKTQFFDKTNKLIKGDLHKNDTFFVRVDYISDTFPGLVKNHDIELSYVKGNFKFLGKTSKNKYKLITGTYSDTIQFDVFLKSKKYIFNDYFLENGVITYELRHKISLCRLTFLTK